MAARKAPAKKAASESKAVATKKDQLPVGIDLGADAGAGMEGTDKDSFAIPFLRVIQKMSPQVDEAEPEFIEGAKPGMFLNSVTSEMFDGKEGIDFYPCAYQRRFLRWGPRSGEGSGFKGEILPEEVPAMLEAGTIVQHENRLYYPNDKGEVNPKTCDHLADTRSHFGLAVDDDGNAMQVLLALTSTQIKKSKQLMSILSNVKVQGPNGKVTPPTWANKIRITTVPESNDQGSWHGVKFESAGFVTDADLYKAGKEFHAAIASGEAKVNYAEAEASPASEADANGKF